MKAKEKSIIEHLKRVKDEKHLTFEEIVNITEEHGERVSLSTVKNVFSENDKHVHDYRNTIKPIARAILGDLNDDQYPIAGSYAAISEYKEFVIEKLEEQLDQYKQQIQVLLQQKESSSRKHKEREAFFLEEIDFYKKQIEWKDSQIKQSREDINRKDAMIRKLLLEDRE